MPWEEEVNEVARELRDTNLQVLEGRLAGVPVFWCSTLLFSDSEGQGSIVIECVMN